MSSKECTEITNSKDPLRQGDIFLFNDNGDNNKFGIIVTGDCDLAHHKSGGIISYCSITTAKYYIEKEIIHNLFYQKEKECFEKEISKQACQLIKAKYSTTFFETLINQDLDELDERLRNNQKFISKFVFYKNNCNKDHYNLDELEKLHLIRNPRDTTYRCKIKEEISSKIISKLNGLEEDKYFLNELPTQTEALGFIINLRMIKTISENDLCEDKNIYKIAHLEAPYLYKMTRRLAAIFADIGEPEEFEKQKTDIIKFLSEELD